MAAAERLNGLIGVLDRGERAFGAFSLAGIDSAQALVGSKFDFVIFDMEHAPWDVHALRDALQYLLDRREIAESGALAPRVTPLVRIPPNGGEMNQWFAKQALDLGCYGVVWPHVSTVAQARNAVSACRYPRLQGAARYDPPGVRGDGPAAAVRYWGVSQQEYYAKADVWPLDPNGEILVVLMIEDAEGVANLPDILEQTPGIGLIMVGPGDLSQELGAPRKYDHPALIETMRKVVETCARFGVPVAHPHVHAGNVEQVLQEGYRALMAGPTRSYAALEAGLKLSGRG